MAHPLSDSHVHLGGSTPWHTLQGHLSEEEFATLRGEAERLQKGASLNDFLAAWFPAVEKAQGDLDFLEESAFAAAKTFAFSHPDARSFELRFCPFLRPADPAQQIRRVQRGLLRAEISGILEYTSLTMSIMRGNVRHLDAAYEYLSTGISGIDTAGPENHAEQDDLWMHRVGKLYETAQEFGLFTTYHSGEGSYEDCWRAVERLPLDRVGHGVALRERIQEEWLLPVFELCPSVNAVTGVAAFDEVVLFAAELHRKGKLFVFGSDNPVVTGVSFAEQWQRIPQFLAEAAASTSRLIRHKKSRIAAPRSLDPV